MSTVHTEPEARLSKVEGGAQVHPLGEDDDLSEWEVIGDSDDRPPGPAGTVVVVDFSAEQAAWMHQEAYRTGLTLAGFLRQLVDEARTAAR